MKKNPPAGRYSPRLAPPALDAYGMSYPTVGWVLTGRERDKCIAEFAAWWDSRQDVQRDFTDAPIAKFVERPWIANRRNRWRRRAK